MELHEMVVSVNSQSVRVWPFGDLQKGDVGFRDDLWARWKRGVAADPQGFILGLGDYFDFSRPTIRRKMSDILRSDESLHHQMDKMVMEQVDKFAKELFPFRKRIIGLCEGHHYHTFVSGMTSTQELCQQLGVRYLGFESVTTLSVRNGKSTLFGIDIYATHGSGGASNPSADMRHLEQKIMPFWDCDIFLRGHSTKVYAVPGHPLCYKSRYRPFTIKKKQRWLVNTGGFMEGRTLGQTSYVEQAGYPSCALGWAVIDIRKEDHHRGRANAGRNIQISVKVETPE